jgi:uncharacterized membrane protein
VKNMTKTSKIILAVVIAAVLIIGVGYAAIQNITLYIEGTANANADQANFTVKLSGTPKVSDETKVTASVVDDTHATLNVSGLTVKGESVTATYTIQNTSADLSADLSASVTNSNNEYFKVTQEIAKSNIEKGAATTITVTVELIKTPITASETSTIGVTVTAAPVQPQ